MTFRKRVKLYTLEQAKVVLRIKEKIDIAKIDIVLKEQEQQMLKQLGEAEKKRLKPILNKYAEQIFDEMIDPELIAKYGKTIEERTALNNYLRVHRQKWVK